MNTIGHKDTIGLNKLVSESFDYIPSALIFLGWVPMTGTFLEFYRLGHHWRALDLTEVWVDLIAFRFDDVFKES